MKKTFALVPVVAILLSLLLMPLVSAQGQAYSSIMVTNLGTAEARIAIYYYNQDGTLDISSPVDDTVAVGQSNVYYPVDAEDGFNGSVVIESTEEIAVISNILYTAPALAQSSWVGFPEGGPELRLPLIMKGNNFNDTSFNIQNTTGEEIDITVEFVPEPGMGYAVVANENVAIPAWSAVTFDQRTMGGDWAAITKWVGSAKVSVDNGGAVAGVVQILNSDWDAVSAYDGFLGGSAAVDLPLIMDDNLDLWTSINCQNLGPGTTTIDVGYVPEAGYPAKPAEQKIGVVENGTAVFLQCFGCSSWVGAATVTNTADNDLACIVNQHRIPYKWLSSYEGLDPDAQTPTVVLPLVHYQPQGDGHDIVTSLNIKNMSGRDIEVTVDWLPEPGQTDIPSVTDFAIADGSVGVVFLYDPYHNGTKWVGGSMVFVEDSVGGDMIAVVVNQQKIGYTADYFSSYDGLTVDVAP